MARFGLLIQNKCIWNNDTLLYDSAYLNQMVNTSQNINLSYGYLWWLNGKASYMVPTLQTKFKVSYVPNAPFDMYAGIGKNGQLVCISPSSRYWYPSEWEILRAHWAKYLLYSATKYGKN